MDDRLENFQKFCDEYAFLIYEKATTQQPMEEFRAINFWDNVPESMTNFSIKTILGTKISIHGSIGTRTVVLKNIE